MPHPRVILLQPHSSDLGPPGSGVEVDRGAGLQARIEATFIGHSEEHLVLETPEAASLRVGDVFYGIPWHVCPTVALHGQAVVVRDGLAVDRWHVTARERMITV